MYKDYVARTYRIEPDLISRLNIYAAKNRMFNSEVVNKAIKEFLERKESK